MKKRAFCLFLAAALCLSALCACTAGANGTTSADSSAGVSISTPSKGKNAMSSRLVGISMPEQAGRWEQEAHYADHPPGQGLHRRAGLCG